MANVLGPKENVATIDMSACVIEGVSRSRNALINGINRPTDGKINKLVWQTKSLILSFQTGETRGYDWDSGYTCHQLGCNIDILYSFRIVLI